MRHPRPRTSSASVVDRPRGTGPPGHPFYARMFVAGADGSDAFVEEACRTLYAPVLGRRGAGSLLPVVAGRIFRRDRFGAGASRGAQRIRCDDPERFGDAGLEQAVAAVFTISRTPSAIAARRIGRCSPWVQQRLVLSAGHPARSRSTPPPWNQRRARIATGYGGSYQAYLTRLADGLRHQDRHGRCWRASIGKRKKRTIRTGGSFSDPDAKVA